MVVVHLHVVKPGGFPSGIGGRNTNIRPPRVETNIGTSASAEIEKLQKAQAWAAIDPLFDALAAEKLSRAKSSFHVDGDEGVGGKGESVGSRRGPVVLLASASRDHLVRIFDASGIGYPCAGVDSGARRRPHGGVSCVDGGGGDGTGERGLAGEEGGGQESRGRGCLPLLKTLDDHSSSVTAVKFSKDGKR